MTENQRVLKREKEKLSPKPQLTQIVFAFEWIHFVESFGLQSTERYQTLFLLLLLFVIEITTASALKSAKLKSLQERD